jgi:hypothetical protein
MADKDSTLTQEYLQSIFEYRDGNLYWKLNTSRKNLIGKTAGCNDKFGYGIVRLKNKNHRLHRLIWLYHYGFLPKIIDHIDNNPLNNKIENLREANNYQNGQNCKRKNASSGYKNIHWHERWGKWQVCIRVNGKAKYFGAYKDIDYAKFIADAMRYKYHQSFANGG